LVIHKIGHSSVITFQGLSLDGRTQKPRQRRFPKPIHLALLKCSGFVTPTKLVPDACGLINDVDRGLLDRPLLKALNRHFCRSAFRALANKGPSSFI